MLYEVVQVQKGTLHKKIQMLMMPQYQRNQPALSYRVYLWLSEESAVINLRAE